MKKHSTLFFSVLLSIASSCTWAESSTDHHAHTADQPGVTVSNAWARALPPNVSTTAVYLELHNHSDKNDQLNGVSSPIAQSSELHDTREVDGLMKMQAIEKIEIAPHQQVALKPGGTHIMLFNVTQPLKAGEHFDLTLSFDSGSQNVIIEVREQAPTPSSHSHHHHH